MNDDKRLGVFFFGFGKKNITLLIFYFFHAQQAIQIPILVVLKPITIWK